MSIAMAMLSEPHQVADNCPVALNPAGEQEDVIPGSQAATKPYQKRAGKGESTSSSTVLLVMRTCW